MKEQIINQLGNLFKQHNNRYVVHKKAASLLEEASRSKEFLYDVIRENLSNPEFLQKNRHYPTLSMPIIESPEFSLIVNIFPPLPSRETDISFQSIHHHGGLLLTTVGAFGPGYGSIIFKKNFKIDRGTCITTMEIEREYQNILSKAEFIDSNQPHIVFYPKDFSATIAFWCDEKPSAKESLKKISWIKKIKTPAVKIASSLRLSKLFGINKVMYFDFHIENGHVKALKNRLTYEAVGDNENFIQNIFCFVQQTGFYDKPFLEDLIKKESTSFSARKFIRQLLEHEVIQDNFYHGHLNIPNVNLKKSTITETLSNA